jgi:D-alanine-D-alanine ligase
MNIAIICGGLSLERNVSLAGGKSVYAALKQLGHTPYMIDPALGKNAVLNPDSVELVSTPPTIEELAQYPVRNMLDCVNLPIFDQIDIAFIVLHGKYGEDGVIQALLEARGIKYTGSGIKAHALGIDKNTSKLVFAATGTQVAPWYPVRRNMFDNYDYMKALRSELGKKMVIKPNDQGSSVGVTIIEDGNIDEINKAIKYAAQFSDLVIAEKFIEGREITVGLIGGEPLPVVEIVPEAGFYDYQHKYVKGHTGYQCPADIPGDIADFAQNIARTAYYAVGCSGFARADFRLNEDGQPIIMEINTIPGFTSTSLVPMAAKQLGIEFPDLCQRIIDLAINPQ